MGTRQALLVMVLVIVLLGGLLVLRAAYAEDGDGDSAAVEDDVTAEDRETQQEAEHYDLVVVGDSFAEQAEQQFRALADEHDLAADVTAFGGTSICSWTPDLEQYAAGEPDILVLSFAGNDLDPCITDDPDAHRDPIAVADDYREDLDATLELFASAGTEVHVVLPPPVGLDIFEERAAAMRDMYRAAPADHPDLGIIDSATHLDPDGQGFQPRLPCAEWDDCPPDGMVEVRESDAIHLQPAGAERYARAVFAGLGLEPPFGSAPPPTP